MSDLDAQLKGKLVLMALLCYSPLYQRLIFCVRVLLSSKDVFTAAQQGPKDLNATNRSNLNKRVSLQKGQEWALREKLMQMTNGADIASDIAKGFLC